MALTGLMSSLGRYESQIPLTVFTDLPNEFPNSEIASMEELLSTRESFYRRPGRRNVFKLALFETMFERYPGESIAWIDADVLVLGDVETHLDPEKVNVIAHGRRDAEQVPLGNGLKVPGSRYAIGGLFSLPDPSWLESMNRIANERPAWNHKDHNSDLGDQLILNHVLSEVGADQIHWLTDDRRFIFNLEIADGLHPYVGDDRLSEITRSGDALYLEDRRIVLFYWIKKQFDLHVADGFQTFKPDVRRLFVDLYGVQKSPRYSLLRRR